ncbi:hypothetical protein Efla_004252 [Eimeria flavescens]
MSGLVSMASDSTSGTTGVVMDIRGLKESSVLLEVGGQLAVPGMRSKEELAEKLASGKYVLDLSGAEIRIAGDVKRAVLNALGLKSIDQDALKSRLVLRGTVYSAPPGSYELVRSFLRKGSREQHFALVRELARRRREELEKSAKKPMPLPAPKKLTTKASADKLKEAPPAAAAHLEEAKPAASPAGEAAKPADVASASTTARQTDKDSLLPQHYEELSSFRSATTASELGTARRSAEACHADALLIRRPLLQAALVFADS